jgi:hypothetical protein
MVNGSEALADAIMHFEGWKPGSRSYVNRNPGNLRRPKPTVDTDDKGFRKFESLVNGYIALVGDIRQKISGHNDHGLGPASTILEYFQVYAPSQDGNDTAKYAEFVAGWLTEALGKHFSSASKLGEIQTIV